MSTNLSFESAWSEYQQALNELYGARGTTAVAATDRGAGELAAEQLPARAQQVLAGSEQVRESLTRALGSDNPGERELAGLKLVAGAAYDLSVANDLLSQEQEGETERAAQSMVASSDDLREVMAAPLISGMAGLIEVERGALPTDPAAARAQLQQTIADFCRVIPQDAASLSQMSVSGVLNLGLGPAQGALSLATQEIMSRVPDTVSPITRHAAEIVTEAICKLRAAIGAETEQQAQDQAIQWLQDMEKNRDAVSSLLDQLYETPRIAAEVTKTVQGAPQNAAADSFNKATQKLTDLQQQFDKSKSILENVMRVMALVKSAFLASPPWGPLALYAAYLSLLAYAVYSGGDYVDWYRTGDKAWLDRVQGLRTTVRTALANQ